MAAESHDNLATGAMYRLNREDLVNPALFERPKYQQNVSMQSKSPALALQRHP